MASLTQSLSLTALSLAVLCATRISAQTFGATPLMGYNSYNQLGCTPTSSTMESAINALSSRGFVAAGYTYFQIDCGWSASDGARNSSSGGALAVDTTRFPRGLQALSDLARAKGMQWAMYSDAGVRMCDTRVPSPVLGSLGSEGVDAEYFKSLGTVYVKYDNCYVDGPGANQNAPKDPRTDFVSRFSAMWNELKRVGIPGMLVCQWGTPYASSTGLQGPNSWTRGISTSFRLSDDIATGWGNVYRIYNQAIHVVKSGLIGPGHFADADLLEVGNPGMTFDEQASHFAAWAMLKSALFVSTNITALSTELLNVLQNKDLIAINQDSAGKPTTLVQRYTGDHDVWIGDLANGDKAVLVVDLSNAARQLSVPFSLLGIMSANAKDLWSGTTTNGVTSFSKSVKAHGSIALRLSGIKTSSTAAPTYNFTAASKGSLANGANVQSCSGCTSKNKVGNLGSSANGRLTLSNIRTSQATQAVVFDYINGEIGYLGGSNNERLASISVNGGTPRTVSFPVTGYNWDADVYKSYAVELSGFSTTGVNTIAISGSGSGYAPDFDRIGIIA
ncbi:glycoside hydrolase [Pseudovirgaria hyperparasitica]|uniref:Alpha-galactosidase n=1 Tax=Pseudovirgaria hyperparasitica TaxID=470096 RepID=A0A6A6WN76_9PEZI|nr:glycoside hydrolase [Pseudovirgaria hyperparasitica]KAF2763472.1 glycoside hydrolase [Pseudovirgaria hyperparasitica]